MTDAERLAFITRVLAITDKHDDHDLWWCVDADGTVRFAANCNDLFEWACSDCEDITPENVAELERAYADTDAAMPRLGTIYAQSLFAARVRGERPQHAAYPKPGKGSTPEEAEGYARLWTLFDAAGPPRPVGVGNPHKHPAETAPAACPVR